MGKGWPPQFGIFYIFIVKLSFSDGLYEKENVHNQLSYGFMFNLQDLNNKILNNAMKG